MAVALFASQHREDFMSKIMTTKVGILEPKISLGLRKRRTP
jgi:hypothetical protein